ERPTPWLWICWLRSRAGYGLARGAAVGPGLACQAIVRTHNRVRGATRRERDGHVGSRVEPVSVQRVLVGGRRDERVRSGVRETGERTVVRGAVGLRRNRRIGDVGLDLRLPRAFALVEERRDGDRGENADDEDDDEEL